MKNMLVYQANVDHFMAQCGWRFDKSWFGRFDVSLWIKPLLKCNVGLELIFIIEDQSRRRAILLDQYNAFSSQEILLTRSIPLSGKGSLKDLKIKLHYQGCEQSEIVLDHFHFKPIPKVEPKLDFYTKRRVKEA
ncbi:hypothetical protein SAMN02745866_01355 [Alteromonadaceae bacterium Bs31]|nr:hypothetical protein SAMN02745866_01355 [Alteromonadaceae bacterium Bs31]